ncbi:Macrod2 protein [Coprinopsis sp. MPI-PUGE-AT-0042]|nr:Macrod2 protein [Coprinopsis sp. MPI-PUGE-AT-0042]
MSNYESDSSDASVDASLWVKHDDKNIKTIGQMYKDGILQRPPAFALDAGAGQGNLATVDSAGTSGDPTTSQSAPTVAGSANTKTYAPNPSLLERVCVFKGDITRMQVDAIVNAANKSLLGGGGVDGHIHRAAGPKLLAECRQLNGANTGESKITKGYNLPARHVIHTVGPVYAESEAEEKAQLLASCYRTSLEVAVENRLKHVAFPAISTGIYGYPVRDATHVALRTVREFLEKSEADKVGFQTLGSTVSDDAIQLEKVIFVIFLDKDVGVYNDLIPQYFPPSKSS